MQFDKSRETSLVSEARLSGISLKRFEDRFRERRVPATGARLFAEIVVMELSASDRYFSLCHFEAGKIFRLRRLELLSLRCAWIEYSLEYELPEPVRFTVEE
jgi:hypothetical protein